MKAIRLPVRQIWRLTPLVAALAASHAANAQTAASDETTAATATLGTVTVTASGYEQDVADAPASITVLTREEIEKKPYANLQDALRDVEGVTITGATANKQDINIRGMPGKYTLILVDGVRQGTRELLNREELGMVQGSQIPPLSAIERIEVVRGPMSSLYGSDALGGVVNIITRKVPEKWTGSLNLGTVLQQHSELGNSRQGDFYLAGPIVDDRIGLQLFGKDYDRSESTEEEGSYRVHDRGLTARLNIKPTANQDVMLEAGQDEYNRRATEGKSLAKDNDGVNDNYKLNTRHTHLRASHTGRWDWGTTNLSVSREIGKTSNASGDSINSSYPDTRISNTVVDAKAVMPLPDNVLTLGGQYTHTKLSGTNNESTGLGGYNTVDKLSASTWSLFGEDEWAITDWLSLTGGLRMDHHSKYGAHWSPRGYLVYHLTDNWTVKGGVARGFRAPELRQSSADYYQSTGGATGAVRGYARGNPDLKPETSTNIELGLHYTDPASGVSGGITYFHNDFKNKIYSQCVENCDVSGSAIYEWNNIGRAKLQGVESSLSVPLTDTITLSGNYTYTSSKRESDDETDFAGKSLRGKPLDRTPRHVLNVRADWQVSPAFSMYAAAHVQSEQYWANFRNGATNTRRRPGATTYDLGASYVVNKNVTMRLAVLNITDKRIPVDYRSRTEDMGNWAVDDGRRLWLNTQVSF